MHDYAEERTVLPALSKPRKRILAFLFTRPEQLPCQRSSPTVRKEMHGVPSWDKTSINQLQIHMLYRGCERSRERIRNGMQGSGAREGRNDERRVGRRRGGAGTSVVDVMRMHIFTVASLFIDLKLLYRHAEIRLHLCRLLYRIL